MRPSQNLLHLDLRQKLIDRKIILGVEVYVAIIIVAVFALLASKHYFKTSIDSISIDKDYVNGIQADIDSVNSGIAEAQSENSTLNVEKEKYSTEITYRGQHYKTQNLLRRLLNYKPNGVSIVSVECNTSAASSDGSYGSESGITGPTGEDGIFQDLMNSASELINGAGGTGEYSNDFITGPDGELYDRATSKHVDSMTFEILDDGKTLDNAVAAPVDVNANTPNDGNIGTQNGNGNTGSNQTESSNGSASTGSSILKYNKDLSKSQMIIKGYADSMKSLSEYITNLNEDYLYIKSYEMTGVQEYKVSDNVKISVFEVILTLEE